MASKLLFYRDYYRSVDLKFYSGQLLIHINTTLEEWNKGCADFYTISFWEGDDLFFSKDIHAETFNDVLKECLSVCDNLGVILEICY